MKKQLFAATALFVSLSTPPVFAGEPEAFLIDEGNRQTMTTGRGWSYGGARGSGTDDACGGFDIYQGSGFTVYDGRPDCNVDRWSVFEYERSDTGKAR